MQPGGQRPPVAPVSRSGPRCAACSGPAAAVYHHGHVAQQHAARARCVADKPGANARPPAARHVCRPCPLQVGRLPGRICVMHAVWTQPRNLANHFFAAQHSLPSRTAHTTVLNRSGRSRRTRQGRARRSAPARTRAPAARRAGSGGGGARRAPRSAAPPAPAPALRAAARSPAILPQAQTDAIMRCGLSVLPAVSPGHTP